MSPARLEVVKNNQKYFMLLAACSKRNYRAASVNNIAEMRFVIAIVANGG